MLCSASFFLKGGLGALLNGLFTAKLYCCFFYYLLSEIFNAHASQITLTMFADRNLFFGLFFFAHNQHIWDLFNFGITDFTSDFFIPKVNKPANIGIF